MSNVSLYIDYFRQLAVRHKDLRHNPASETGDALPGSKHFTKISIDEVVTGLRSKVGWPCLVLELYETETASEIVYDVRQQPTGAFMLLDHPEGTALRHEEACYVKADRIIQEILQQIWQDHYSPGINRCFTPFKEFYFDKIGITPVGPLFDKEFGYRVTFGFELQQAIDLTTPPPSGTFL